jgi:phosphoglucosamine mutase
VRETGADIGLAFDGDADRMLAVDSTGELIDGDRIMAICALDLKARGLLARDSLVVTVMSNLGLRVAMEQVGASLSVTAVGDRYVLERMLEEGYNIGEEPSGHVIFLSDNTTGDGLVSAIRLLGALRHCDQSLAERKKVMDVYPQVLVNVTIDNGEGKELVKTDEVINLKIRSIEESYAGRGRVLVRPSGTEPLIRVMVEGADGSRVRQDAEALARLIKERLG